LREDRRHCTDILFTIVFGLFLIGMLVIALYGFSTGDPVKYFSGVDNDGKICGYDDYDGWERLYFPDLSSTTTVKQKYFCVKGGCPRDSGENIDCKPTTTANCNDASFTRYNSTSYLDRYCLPVEDELPTNLRGNYNEVIDWLRIDTIAEWIYDIAKGWPILLLAVAFTLILCMIFMVVIEYFAAVLAWICIIGSFLCLIGLGFFFMFTRDSSSNEDSAQSDYNIVWACLCWIAAFLMFVFICCTCSALRVAIGVIQASADFITDTKRILVVPVIGFVVVISWYTLWIVIACFIYTIGDIEGTDSGGKRVQWDDTTRRVWYYHFFGLFWINSFIDAFFSFVIIVATSTWYFSHGTEVEGSASVTKGFKWIFRYHFGSLALGSLIIAIVQVIRFCFEYLRNRLQNANPGNAALQCFLCTISYCLACLNRFIKFITKNAYIQVALTSRHFCLSAWNAFILIIRNAARFTFVEWIAFMFAILGKFSVVSAVCFLSYFIINQWDSLHDDLSSYFPVIFAVALISYGICTVFFDVFSTAGNTILQCFILDSEISNAMGRGSAGHQPPALRKFIKQIKRDKGEEVSDSGEYNNRK
jgi:hypothetical protein